MKVRVLGAHNLEAQATRHTCFLLDDVMAIDAGSLMTALRPDEQKNIEALLLTHRHFDHVRDVPSLGLANLDHGGTISMYALPSTLEEVSARLMDGVLYPDFTKNLADHGPKYLLQAIAPGQDYDILGYMVRPISVPHSAPAVGYIVHEPDGGSFAYCGDTGGGLLPFFQDPLRPDPLFIEVTFAKRMRERALATGHLTPDLLGGELAEALRLNLPIPRIMIVHRSPYHEDEITHELNQGVSALSIEVTLAQEDMTVSV